MKAGAFGTSNIGTGLKKALTVGTERVVALLGAADGFNTNPEIHIPLPETLRKVQSALQAVGMSSMADDVELRLNRAAEAAVPKAKKSFVDAIAAMTLNDITGIYNGPPDSATRYFQSKMSALLAEEMRPVIDGTLAEVEAIQAYDAMIGQYKEIPFVPSVKADLIEHVIARAMDGLFLYLGKEEAATRENPAMRSTDLLKKVFGKI
ncbi:MAG TPA: DUF4197 domain-containing protein [Sneathiellales bacterium]|nr:DUF4197 domain-containing protein [Sneathiellales bacterium]